MFMDDRDKIEKGMALDSNFAKTIRLTGHNRKGSRLSGNDVTGGIGDINKPLICTRHYIDNIGVMAGKRARANKERAKKGV